MRENERKGKIFAKFYDIKETYNGINNYTEESKLGIILPCVQYVISY